MGAPSFVAPSKLRGYLLSATHPDGSHTARLFRALGFDLDTLERTIIALARSAEVASIERTRHGVKHVIEGLCRTPTDTTVMLRTVWIVDSGADFPRLVTAYPIAGPEANA